MVGHANPKLASSSMDNLRHMFSGWKDQCQSTWPEDPSELFGHLVPTDNAHSLVNGRNQYRNRLLKGSFFDKEYSFNGIRIQGVSCKAVESVSRYDRDPSSYDNIGYEVNLFSFHDRILYPYYLLLHISPPKPSAASEQVPPL